MTIIRAPIEIIPVVAIIRTGQPEACYEGFTTLCLSSALDQALESDDVVPTLAPSLAVEIHKRAMRN